MNAFKYIDLAYTDQIADGDLEMKKVMIGMLLEDPVDEIQKMTRLTEEGNWDELRKVSHKMKSTLAFVGNTELTNTNKRVELLSKEEVQVEELPALVSSLNTLYMKAVEELRAVHESL